MICEQFNMSYIQVRDDIDLHEYWQLLAVAYDADEREDHNFASLVAIAVNNPKKLRNWKYATPDKAGTRPESNDVTQTLVGFALMNAGGNFQGNTGDMTAFAQYTGRRIIHMVGENTFIDQSGEIVEKTRDDLVLPLPQSSEHVH
jgi:hypothetical protein